MDHDTESDFCFHATEATCQACGFYRDFQDETLEQVQHELNEWCMQVIDIALDPKKPPAHLAVLTCPTCAELTRDAILERYRLRIRGGEDRRFH